MTLRLNGRKMGGAAGMVLLAGFIHTTQKCSHHANYQTATGEIQNKHLGMEYMKFFEFL